MMASSHSDVARLGLRPPLAPRRGDRRGRPPYDAPVVCSTDHCEIPIAHRLPLSMVPVAFRFFGDPGNDLRAGGRSKLGEDALDVGLSAAR